MDEFGDDFLDFGDDAPKKSKKDKKKEKKESKSNKDEASVDSPDFLDPSKNEKKKVTRNPFTERDKDERIRNFEANSIIVAFSKDLPDKTFSERLAMIFGNELWKEVDDFLDKGHYALVRFRYESSVKKAKEFNKKPDTYLLVDDYKLSDEELYTRDSRDTLYRRRDSQTLSFNTSLKQFVPDEPYTSSRETYSNTRGPVLQPFQFGGANK